MVNRPRKFAAAISAASLLAAYGVATGVATAGAAAKKAKKSTIQIAALEATTGASRLYGSGEIAGEEFYYQQVNKSGGVDGHPIKVTNYNTNTTPATGVANVRSIIANSKYLAISGVANSTVAAAIDPLAQQAGIPTLDACSATTITDPLKSYVYRTFVSNTFSSEAIIKYLKSKKHVASLAMIYPTDNFGKSAKTAFAKYANEVGIHLTAVSFAPTSTDMTSEVISAESSHPQAYLAWTATTPDLTLLKNMYAQGIRSSKTPIFSPPISAFPATISAAGPADSGVYFLGQMAINDPNPGIQEKFINALIHATGTDPTTGNTLGYQMGQIIVKGLRNVLAAHKRLTRANLRHGLDKLHHFATVYGSVTYSSKNHTGVPLNAVQINQISSGGKTVKIATGP